MNKHSLIFSTALFICSIIFLISCDKKVGKFPREVVAPPPGACDTITYNKHIKKIMDDNCGSCHSPANPQGNTSLGTYNEVKDKGTQGRIKARVIDENPSPMPQPPMAPLSAEQKSLIKCWLENGMKE